MAAPSRSTCSPWTEEDEVTACPACGDYNVDSALLDEAIQVASDVLYELSGRRFPGTCEETIRPCRKPRCRGSGDPTLCSCGGVSEVLLRGSPVTEVLEVKVDGDVLPASEYRIDEHRWLVRLPDSSGTRHAWPCCQDVYLDDSEDNTFSVSYEFGQDPPPAGRMAASRLACELILACDPAAASKCRLPKRVTSVTRQGVSMTTLDPFDFLDKGQIGIYEADLFIQAYNPGRGRAASVWSPDTSPRGRRADTAS